MKITEEEKNCIWCAYPQYRVRGNSTEENDWRDYQCPACHYPQRKNYLPQVYPKLIKYIPFILWRNKIAMWWFFHIYVPKVRYGRLKQMWQSFESIGYPIIKWKQYETN